MSDFIFAVCIIGATCVAGLVLGHEATSIITPLFAILGK